MTKEAKLKLSLRHPEKGQIKVAKWLQMNIEKDYGSVQIKTLVWIYFENKKQKKEPRKKIISNRLWSYIQQLKKKKKNLGFSELEFV